MSRAGAALDVGLRVRRLAREAAVVCFLLALYFTWARPRPENWILAAVGLTAAGVLIVIGAKAGGGTGAKRPRSDAEGDYEEGRSGSVPDGQTEPVVEPGTERERNTPATG